MMVKLSCHSGPITIPRHPGWSAILIRFDQAIEGLVIEMIEDLESLGILDTKGVFLLDPEVDCDELIIREITVCLYLDIHENRITTESNVEDPVIIGTATG